MLTGRFDPRLFFQRAENVALAVSAEELFGLLKRSLDLPSQWAALLRNETGGYRVAAPGATIQAADLDEVLFVRVSPVEVILQEGGVSTADQFRCDAQVQLSVSVVPDRSELLAFLKSVVGSHRVAQATALARFLQPAVRAVLAAAAAEHNAADLVNGRLRERLSARVADAVQAALFSAGMVLAAPPVIRFDSRTLRRVEHARQEAAARRAEHEAARPLREALDRARAEHLEHLSSLLARLKELAADAPDVKLPDLVRTFAERERGEIYAALFACEPAETQTRWIAVAAGNDVLFFDPATVERPARKVTIDGEVGPIRSISAHRETDGKVVLWLGAATGVYRLPVDHAAPDLTLAIPDPPPTHGGFNAVAVLGDRLWASHSQLGLWEWDLCDAGRSRPRFESLTRDAKAVRSVQQLDGNLFCAIDRRLICWPADDPTDRPERMFLGSISTITALCATPAGLYAGNSEGDVLYWPFDRQSDPDRLHMGSHRPVESLRVLTAHGVQRLFYTDTSLHVHARVLSDTFACRYEAGGQTIRRVEVAPDCLVATNDLRDRLILWSTGLPTAPKSVISVARLCGHSVQDVVLIPRA